MQLIRQMSNEFVYQELRIQIYYVIKKKFKNILLIFTFIWKLKFVFSIIRLVMLKLSNFIHFDFHLKNNDPFQLD